MRNNDWLETKLEEIWQTHFADVTKANTVTIKFGCKARTRLGSIRLVANKKLKARKEDTLIKAPSSLITITGYFRDERVPEFIVDSVITHELCHYAHGFSSPLPQQFRYPHQGGAVDHELIKRGLGDALIAQRKWLKSEWKNVIGPVHRRTVRRKRRTSIFQFFMP